MRWSESGQKGHLVLQSEGLPRRNAVRQTATQVGRARLPPSRLSFAAQPAVTPVF